MFWRDYRPLDEPVRIGDISLFGYDFDTKQPIVGRLEPSMSMLQYQRSAWDLGAEAFTDAQIKQIEDAMKPLIEMRER